MSSATPITVSVVENDDQFREALVTVIRGARGFHCASAHADARDALKKLPVVQPEVVLMDIHLGQEVSGVDCMRELIPKLKATKFVMLTVEEQPAEVFKALQAGALGYLVKGGSFAEIIDAIRELHDGGSPMSPSIARHVMKFFHALGKTTHELKSLTPTETKVLELLAQGLSNKQIGSELKCAEHTVAVHCQNIYRKLHVHSRTEAVVKYLKSTH